MILRALFISLFSLLVAALSAAPARQNVLIITMDDMSCDSVGVYGSKLKDTTPNMDRLAAQSLRFNHAFVQVGNCMPSRNVMFSGRYPHNNRVEGFYMIKDPGYPVMSDLMKGAGWFTGIRGKVAHSTPYSPYPAWDAILDTLPDGTAPNVKNVASYHAVTAHGIALAKKAAKPFCLNINISDPHKPFWNEDGRPEVNKPSRVFTAAEVPVPGFLPDDPQVREELALYYSSVRRGDDCLGEVLRALRESGEDERTVIFFLSDHGMPLPFAKTQLYFHSTRTPWMIRWPGVTKPGSVDDTHLVSGVDLLPTLLDVVGVAHPKGMDGRSFAPVLRGEKQAGRDYVVTEYNENSGGHRHPMRALMTPRLRLSLQPVVQRHARHGHRDQGHRHLSPDAGAREDRRRRRRAAEALRSPRARGTLPQHRRPRRPPQPHRRPRAPRRARPAHRPARRVDGADEGPDARCLSPPRRSQRPRGLHEKS